MSRQSSLSVRTRWSTFREPTFHFVVFLVWYIFLSHIYKNKVTIIDDARPASRRMVESFQNKLFPSGYPYSVNEGYLRYTQFRALSILSTQMPQLHLRCFLVSPFQSLLFAAGLRPTPAQATDVSWILKDGMQHVGKLICSNLGSRMDSEPKSWRLLADVLYDLGTGLEVLSPLCPHLFLEMAGLGNFAKGMAVVAARVTRLPIYSSFAKEGNLSDLFAKGEAISTMFNVLGIGAGIQLASIVCSSMQGKILRSRFTNIAKRFWMRNNVFSPFLSELQAKGWHTDRFLDGNGCRFAS
ncbi:hypothetical protein RD792_003264 [Penstemon davidsonii]|uniref:Protein root UVB sensitive/RUS domain-containing protein n=1 Tax=Penstemon davidsonii TaxID=160366 RepID=A0ABR0DTE3_9LAMI|nr:hypothetical protein RD792_003264 [Penstemon davidsonii]